MTEVKTDKHFDILPPKNQLRLFGYNKHFEDFIKLFKKGKLPNKILSWIPILIRAAALVIFRVTNVSPRLGLSWLNKIPLQAYKL